MVDPGALCVVLRVQKVHGHSGAIWVTPEVPVVPPRYRRHFRLLVIPVCAQ